MTMASDNRLRDQGPLAEGTRIPTMLGGQVVVGQLIGSGGQGHVYVCRYNQDKMMALKWYRPGVFVDRDKFIRNLRGNIMKGSPTSDFLWPQDMTVMLDGSFGYVMELCPAGYFAPDDFFCRRPGAIFPSYRRAIDACLNIVHAFRILHNEGYSYQDISGGNFFIHPSTGKVLICDNDNVAPNGSETGIRGTPRYMAPEIVCDQWRTPNTQSDRHSMSVLIFMLLLMNHPLEGRRMTSMMPLDGRAQRDIYGEHALFIKDEHDTSNAPDPLIHRNVEEVWPHLPSYVRALFQRAFSQRALHEPARRPSESEWVSVLARFRSEVVACPCKHNEVFMDGARPVRCEHCGRVVSARLCLDLGSARIPVCDDARVYRCQTSVCDADEALVPLVRIVTAHGRQNLLGLHNVSSTAWHVRLGAQRLQVESGEVVPAIAGEQFRLGDITLCVRDIRQRSAS